MKKQATSNNKFTEVQGFEPMNAAEAEKVAGGKDKLKIKIKIKGQNQELITANPNLQVTFSQVKDFSFA